MLFLIIIQRNSELFKVFKIGKNVIERELVLANKGVRRRPRGDEGKDRTTGGRRAGFQPGEELMGGRKRRCAKRSNFSVS